MGSSPLQIPNLPMPARSGREAATPETPLMDMLQAIAIAILQGATELFPVSSLGHAVVLPAVLGWGVDQKSDQFLPFLVLLHTGTALALLGYFWRDWLALGLGVLGLGGDAQRVRDARRMTMLIVIATIPAVIVGYSLRKVLGGLFAAPVAAAGFLVVNGFLLLFGERLRRGVPATATVGAAAATKTLPDMTAADALAIGVWQCGALLPGISRAGATMVGGLLRGLNHEDSAHFSFLIALPIIVGATVLEVPHLLHASVAPGVFTQAAVAAVAAGLTALLTTWFLMRYFRNNDRWALSPFAYYCIVVGLGCVAYLGLR